MLFEPLKETQEKQKSKRVGDKADIRHVTDTLLGAEQSVKSNNLRQETWNYDFLTNG
jgi:hypothetical protein